MEYCYHKLKRSWENCDNRMGTLSNNDLKKLKDPKLRSSEFIKTVVRYKSCSYKDVYCMYNDISDFAFFLGDRIVLMYSTTNVKSTHIFSRNEIINYSKTFKKLKNNENPESARLFVLTKIRDYYYGLNYGNGLFDFALSKKLVESNFIKYMSDTIRLYLELNPIVERDII